MNNLISELTQKDTTYITKINQKEIKLSTKDNSSLKFEELN